MQRDRPYNPFESHRAYRYLVLVELLLSALALAVWIAVSLGW